MIWCLGFITPKAYRGVVLLRKSKTMHIDRWNGLGGKIEENESPLDAMVRECKEESGLEIARNLWSHVGYLEGTYPGTSEEWRVWVYGSDFVPQTIPTILGVGNAPETKSDTPYMVPFNVLSYMSLADHVSPLVHACFDKVTGRQGGLIKVTEVYV